jgi:hypothetical protein
MLWYRRMLQLSKYLPRLLAKKRPVLEEAWCRRRYRSIELCNCVASKPHVEATCPEPMPPGVCLAGGKTHRNNPRKIAALKAVFPDTAPKVSRVADEQ